MNDPKKNLATISKGCADLEASETRKALNRHFRSLKKTEPKPVPKEGRSPTQKVQENLDGLE